MNEEDKESLRGVWQNADEVVNELKGEFTDPDYAANIIHEERERRTKKLVENVEHDRAVALGKVCSEKLLVPFQKPDHLVAPIIFHFIDNAVQGFFTGRPGSVFGKELVCRLPAVHGR